MSGIALIDYGAGNLASVRKGLAAVGAEVYSFGQCNPASTACGSLGDPMTFIFGFAGVGGTPVGTIPEPGTLALFGSGLAGAIARRYRRRKA